MHELFFAGLVLFSSLGTISAAEGDFGGFLDLQEKLYQAVKQRFDSLEGQVESLAEQVASLNTSNHHLQQENEILRQQLEDLRNSTANNFSSTNENVVTLTGKVTNTQILASTAKFTAEHALEQTKNSITDVRFSQQEQGQLWKGSGFLDTPGYLITGIDNTNKDAYVDHAFRRRIEYHRDGTWHGVTWL